MFTKSDVKESDWVVLRNGKVFRALKLNDEFVLVSEDDWYLLESYRDTLLWPASPPHKLDIMKIIRPTKVTDLFASCYQYGKTVFDRDKGIGCDKQFSKEAQNHLKSLLAFGFRFIAREYSGSLLVFKSKPTRTDISWCNDWGDCLLTLPSDLFPQIMWKDEEPFDIKAYFESECAK